MKFNINIVTQSQRRQISALLQHFKMHFKAKFDPLRFILSYGYFTPLYIQSSFYFTLITKLK